MNALEQSRRTTSRVCAVAATMTLIAAAWAFRPLRLPPALPEDAAPSTSTRTAAAIDPSAFEVEVWSPGIALPAPVLEAAAKPDPPPAPPPPPRIRVQLIGIHMSPGEESVRRATLYDPDADRLLVVAAGDVVAGREVASVDEGGVLLRMGAFEQRLTLHEEPRP